MPDLVLEAIKAFKVRLTADWSEKVLPPRVVEPLAHPNCLCYVDKTFLKDGQPVEIWRSIRIWTTCQVCIDLDNTIISEGPWYGDKVR
jgi:hypothetical protein